ncbi:MAG: hypothetical protein QM777_26985 [Pseudorhodoferax sp.]
MQHVLPVVHAFAGHGRLQQRRPPGRRDQAPRRAIGVVRRQRQQGGAPAGGIGPGRVLAGAVQGDGGQLREEGVPRVALVRAQGGEVAHRVGGQGRQQGRQAAVVQITARHAAPADQGFVQDVEACVGMRRV